jgi:hypothetical protein
LYGAETIANANTRDAVQVVIVAAAGFRHNANSDMVVQVVGGDDLFAI